MVRVRVKVRVRISVKVQIRVQIRDKVKARVRINTAAYTLYPTTFHTRGYHLVKEAKGIVQLLYITTVCYERRVTN